MMQGMKKKLLPSVMAAAFISGATLSGGAQAIHLSEDGIGQVLLGPLYIALEDSYESEIAIVNTRNDAAVKAKVVLRSQVTSLETLDFICYLTPADVCRFKIENRNGQAWLYSDDDSIKSRDSNGNITFASIVPVEQQLFDQNLGPGDTNELGHIEVIGAYGAAGNIVVPGGDLVRVTQGMSKFDLAKIFDAERSDLEAVSILNVETAAETRDAAGNLVPTPAGTIRSTDPTWVKLMGQVAMVAPNGDRMGYRFSALAGEIGDNVPPEGTFTYAADFTPIPQIRQGVTIPFDGRVISNPFYDVTIATESALGFEFGFYSYGLPLFIYDNIIEIEHALAVSDIQGTYEDDSSTRPTPGVKRTQLLVTFPTKYRHLQDVCGSGNAAVSAALGRPWYPPFQAIGPIDYSLTEYDNQENNTTISGAIFSGGVCPVRSGVRQSDDGCGPNTLPSEVNYFLPDWEPTNKDASGNVLAGQLNFESGWFNMSMIPVAGCTYPGAPILSMAHKYIMDNGQITNSWLVPNSHKPELVNRNFPEADPNYGMSNPPGTP